MKEMETMLPTHTSQGPRKNKIVKIEKGSFSYLSRSMGNPDHRNSLQRLLCLVLTISLIFGGVFFVWELDYIQPGNLLSRYTVYWTTSDNHEETITTISYFKNLINSKSDFESKITFQHRKIPNHSKIESGNIKLFLNTFIMGKVTQNTLTPGAILDHGKQSKNTEFTEKNTEISGTSKYRVDTRFTTGARQILGNTANVPKIQRINKFDINDFNKNIVTYTLKAQPAHNNATIDSIKLFNNKSSLSSPNPKSASVTSTVVKSVSMVTLHSPSHYVTLDFQGRLGNLLFQYASLRGIASKNNLIPIISSSLELNKYFYLNCSKNYHARHYQKTYREKKGCTFEPEVLNLGEHSSYKLWGYFQSWKYFQNIENLLRKEFKFNNDINTKASEQFSEIVSKVKSSSLRKVTYVAVHVRRGDMVTKKEYLDYGYVSADADYLTRAMKYFRSKITNPVFVMASDDQTWCKKNFNFTDVVFIKPGNSAVVDMAILTKCQHALLTVGSFGWWIGWLINGITVFCKDYPKPGTKLAALFTPEDYTPPQWIGL